MPLIRPSTASSFHHRKRQTSTTNIINIPSSHRPTRPKTASQRLRKYKRHGIKFDTFLSALKKSDQHGRLSGLNKDAVAEELKRRKNILNQVAAIIDQIESEHYNKYITLLAKHLETKYVPKNTVLIKQGDFGDKFYIIESGSCVVTFKHDLKNITQEPKVLGYKRAKDWFGEVALLDEETATRTATVTTCEDCKFFILHREIFLKTLGRTKTIHEQKQLEFRMREIQQVIAFRNLSLNSVQKLVSNAKSRRYFKHEHIFQYGDHAQSFYVLVEGKVQLSVPGHNGTSDEKVISVRQAHDYIGEAFLIPGQKNTRMFTATCMGDVICIVINGNVAMKQASEVLDILSYQFDIRHGASDQEMVKDKNSLLYKDFTVDEREDAEIESHLQATMNTIFNKVEKAKANKLATRKLSLMSRLKQSVKGVIRSNNLSLTCILYKRIWGDSSVCVYFNFGGVCCGCLFQY